MDKLPNRPRGPADPAGGPVRSAGENAGAQPVPEDGLPLERKPPEEPSGPSIAGRVARVAGVLVALAVVAMAFLWLNCGVRGCPDVALLRGYSPDEASVVLDREGEEISKLFLVRRVVVPLDSLPEHVPEAFIAIEDQRFWEHDGVDWRRMVGAVVSTARSVVGAGGQLEGGSTITMQTAGNLFPERLDRSERTLWRKIGEMRVAGMVEDEYGKEEILELYLNQIYFGEGAYGIEAAAQEYFGVSASELSLSQAALLAGLPVAPSRLNPRNDLAAATERRRLVLRRMAEQGMITPAEADEAASAEVELADVPRRPGEQPAPYFVEAVRRVLEDELGESIYTGGYRIHTTLDLTAQRVLEEELERQLRAVERGAYGAFRHAVYSPSDEEEESASEYLQGAGVLLDAGTGDVLALVGGRDYDDSEYNRATQAARQPGSAFKPFVYAAALARGYPATYPLDDTPLRLEIDGRVWEPRNYGGDYSGRISLREALVRSKNVATVRLAREVGIPGVIRTARTAGLDADLPDFPSIALGSAEVTLLDLASAYSVFANLGDVVEPRLVSRVARRDGTVVWDTQPRRRSGLDPAVAFLVTDILQDVVNRGTGSAVRAVGYRGSAAGKTGTTNEGTDVWFIGFTPERVAGFWIGFDDPRTITSGATGGGFAAPIWGRTMRRLPGSGGGWSAPPGVETRLVDAAGNPVGENCPTFGEVREEYFLSGSSPAPDCYAGYYAWGDSLSPWDSLYYDSLYGDSAGLARDSAGEEGWLQRMRERLFGPEADSLRRAREDSLRLERERNLERLDSLRRARQEGDTTRRRPPNLLGRPVRPDTTRPPPDTTGTRTGSG